MLIPLTDSIWSRLYGPYGATDVTESLRRLLLRWDKDVADELFWERLHHQESLYPVTYAALPWLRGVARQGPEARREVLKFLSWVAFCAVGDARRPDERFAGLSLDLTNHQFKWLSKEVWLTDADIPVLTALSDWMEAELPRIVTDCVAEMKGETDRSTAIHLAFGPLAIWGGPGAVRAVEMWNDGEDLGFIREELELSQSDILALHRLVTMLSGAQIWLREFAFQLDGRESRPDQDELPL